MSLFVGVSIILVIAVMITSIIPIILPITIGLISYTIVQDRNIWYLMSLIFIASLLSNKIIWEFDDWLIRRLGTNHTTRGSGWIERTIRWLSTQLKRTHHPLTSFGLICVGSWSAFPDLILTRLVRHQVSFVVYSSAMTIGKLSLYIPIIWATYIAIQGSMMMSQMMR